MTVSLGIPVSGGCSFKQRNKSFTLGFAFAGISHLAVFIKDMRRFYKHWYRVRALDENADAVQI